eukprot:655531-Pelagomonas_calceolata.AAC.26
MNPVAIGIPCNHRQAGMVHGVSATSPDCATYSPRTQQGRTLADGVHDDRSCHGGLRWPGWES